MQLKKISLAIALLGLMPSLHASQSGVVISQLYGGQNNVYNQDYVELFNASGAAVDVTGWSIQYSSATGTGNFSANGVTVLSGSIAPGQYYLVGLRTGTTGASLTGVSASNNATDLSGTNGKLVLVKSATGLACNGGSTACSTEQRALIEDLVGYGTANFFEGAAAPAATATRALFRANNGCTDSDNNQADFATGTPAPRNVDSPRNVCAGTGGGVVNQPIVPSCSGLSLQVGEAGNVQVSASDADSVVNAISLSAGARNEIALNLVQAASAEGGAATAQLQVAAGLSAGSYPVTVQFANDDAQIATCQVTVTVQNTPVTRIYDIQGSGLGVSAASPLLNQNVLTEGVVTAVMPGLSGFYLQDVSGDGNPLTSDGIFVFMGSGIAPTVQVGQTIRLNATVNEFNTVTQLVQPTNIQVTGTASVQPVALNLPEATEGDLEAVEGMLVEISSPLTVSQNFFQGRYGQVTLSVNGRMTKPTNIYPANSAEALQLADENARRRIVLDDGSSAQNPNPIPFIGADNTLRAGDVIPSLVGVIDHGLITNASNGPRDYKIHPTQPVVSERVNQRLASPPVVNGNVKVASFNVLNYFTTFVNGSNVAGQTGQGCSLGNNVSAGNCRGANNLTEFNRQRNKIIAAMSAINADVVGLMEIQNNGAVAVQNLVDGLNTVLGAGTYARVPDPVAGTGTDAIKVAMIYKPAKVTLVGGALSDTNVVNNRPTLAQTFSALNGEKFSVLVNHFKSKGCDTGSASADFDQNDGQGCFNQTRTAQAERLKQFAQTVQAQANDPDLLIIGDLNSYGVEEPILSLANGGYVDLIARFNGQAGYTYVFDGESGYLDHALANVSLAAQITNATEWHINADEPSVIDYNTEFKPQDLYANNPYRSSDHDPVVVGLQLLKKVQGTAQRDTLVGTAGDDVLEGGIGADTITGGAGNDTFVYTSMRDGVDTITDFTPGQDQLDIRALLQSLGYSGSQPFAEGVTRWVTIAGGVQLQIDPDGSAGAATARPLLTLKGIAMNALEAHRDVRW